MDLDHGTCRLSTPLTPPDVMIDNKLTGPMGVSTLLVRYNESAVRVEQGDPYLASPSPRHPGPAWTILKHHRRDFQGAARSAIELSFLISLATAVERQFVD